MGSTLPLRLLATSESRSRKKTWVLAKYGILISTLTRQNVRIRKRTDKFILSMLMIVYFLQALDKTSRSQGSASWFL